MSGKTELNDVESAGITLSTDEPMDASSDQMEMQQQRADRSVPIENFPPLPKPDYKTQSEESRIAYCTVISLSIVMLVLSHGMYFVGDVSMVISAAFLIPLWVCVLVAYIGLCGMLNGDPGIIRRSPENCYPLPAEIVLALRGGRPITTRQNIPSRDGTKTFCVRCLVWRPKRKSHHCRVCGHCVKEFDHHCGENISSSAPACTAPLLAPTPYVSSAIPVSC